MKDVAAAAGVSPMTVSLALRADDQIPPATRGRVIRAAERLRYVPAESGRFLKSGRAGRIAFVASRLAHAFVGQVLAGIEQRSYDLKRYQNAILPYSTWYSTEEREKALREIVYGGNADAVIMVSMHPQAAMVKDMRSHGIPLVLVEDRVPGAHSVQVDNVQGARLATERLLKDGCRRIGLVVGEQPKQGLETNHPALERREGFRRALAAAGLKPDPALVADIGFYLFEEGRTALDDLLRRQPRLDGVFCAAGDRVAMGLLERARERGLQVPEDLKVVGYDDIQGSQLLNPPLTTVHQPVEEMGAKALDFALAALDAPGGREKHWVYKPELKVRGTA